MFHVPFDQVPLSHELSDSDKKKKEAKNEKDGTNNGEENGKRSVEICQKENLL